MSAMKAPEHEKKQRTDVALTYWRGLSMLNHTHVTVLTYRTPTDRHTAPRSRAHGDTTHSQAHTLTHTHTHLGAANVHGRCRQNTP